MTFTEAAAEVLRLAGKPLHYKEITELAIEKNLLSHVGKSPEVTMGARLAALLKKEDKTNPIVRVKPGVFALREWDDKKKKGASRAVDDDDNGASQDINALEVEAATAAPRGSAYAMDDEEDSEETEVSGEDALRADLAAQGAEIFDDEDDDDQPILAAPSAAGPASSAAGAEGGLGEGGRRRRRRRRRGRGGGGGFDDRASTPRMNEGGRMNDGREGRMMDGRSDGIAGTPVIGVDGDTSVEVGRDPLAPAPRPQIRERHQIMAGGAPSGIDVPAGEGEELAGKELADAALAVLASFDRNAGPVPMRSLLEGLMRRGRLAGDPSLAGIQLNAALRGDNMRRLAAGQRPRFRFAAGARVAPTDWALGGDLARLEQEVVASVERYREASRRFMLRRVQELPGPSFVELALTVMERVGITQIRPVRRAGAPGGEAHFAGVHRTGSDEIRTAIVIRKDGREIGRERVSDLRGALHHYGPASSGWLITTGQVLSGAKEEAAAQSAPPVALYDGMSLCRLLEESDVGVIRAKYPIAIPDLDFLDMLRG
jgi:hypothetical protein